MTVRKLCVYIDTQQVGSLSETDSIWQFDYDGGVRISVCEVL